MSNNFSAFRCVSAVLIACFLCLSFAGEASLRSQTPVPRVLIEGSGGPDGPTGGRPTNVTIDGLQMQGTLSSRTVVSWGMVIRDLAHGEIVDVVFIDGDIRSIGNRGTILTGFHLNGVVVVEPSAKPTDVAGGFFSELMRLSVAGGDTFTTKVIGGET